MKTAIAVSLLALQTIQPGQMTQAKVWIQNKGSAETIPVDLRESNLAAPLRVHVVNAEPAYGSTNPVPVRITRQGWEYQTVTVSLNADPRPALNRLGADGWETTGITLAAPNATLFVLKRQR